MAAQMLKKILASILLVHSCGALANQALTLDNQNKIVSNGSIAILQTNDFVNGKSINIFNTLDISGNNLTIYSGNAPSNTETQLVISARRINLRNANIKVIGKPVDLVFIMRAEGDHTPCNNCTIENAKRITFATSLHGIDSSENILISKNASLTVQNINAPGAQSLEFLSNTLNVAGLVNTHLFAENHPAGGFVITPDGSQVVGAGGVNFYSGAITFNYPKSSILSAQISQSHLTVTGTVKAAAISLASTGNIVVKDTALLDTNSDFISTSSRNNMNYVPVEGIFVQNIRASETDTTPMTLSLSGRLLTDHVMSIKSLTNLEMLGNFYADKFQAIAGDEIVQKGYIQTKTDVEFAAKSFFNFGTMASGLIKVDTVDDIVNSRNGRIKATTLAFKSSNGDFLNGARHPKMNFPGKIDTKVINPLTNTTSSKQGIFYQLSDELTSNSSINNVAAQIYANKISISAKNIENINPYYIDKNPEQNWIAGIPLNIKLANQVSLIAEEIMELDARGYVLNVSAILGQNDYEGRFDINTPNFYNQRYKIDSTVFLLNAISRNSSEKVIALTSNTQSLTGIETVLTSYSPAGRLYAHGPFYFSDGNSLNATKENFSNDISYVELLNSSYFHNSNVMSIGYYTSKTFNVDFNSYRNCLIQDACKNSTFTVDISIDTLFSFKGNVHGISNAEAQSNFTVDNINAGDATVKDFIANYLAAHSIKPVEGSARYDNTTGIFHYNLQECRPRHRNTQNRNGVRYYMEEDYDDVCAVKQYTLNVRELIKNNNPNYVGVKYSEDKISAAAAKYIKTLKIPDSQVEGYREPKKTDSMLVSFPLTEDKTTVQISYRDKFSYLEEVVDNRNFESYRRQVNDPDSIRYIQRTTTTDVIVVNINLESLMATFGN